jgi:hypothetical protein
MNKFLKNLTQDGAAIKEARATLVGGDAESAQSKLVTRLEDEMRKLQRQKLTLSDLYPDSELSLQVTRDKFDADKWANDLHNVNIAILNKTVELNSALATQKEWFTDEESISKQV